MVFSHLGFWSGNLFLIAPFPDLCLLVPFNIQINGTSTGFVDFVETLFGCMQQIKQFTTDSGSVLDLIFSNSEGFCDVLEAYWSDHKLIYCAIDK